jgi:pimeloyl-ACP methyl ester carboxylesterase
MCAYTNQQIAGSLRDALTPLGIVPIDQDLEGEVSISGLRRRRGGREDDSIGVITLLDIDGVLIWEDGAVTSSTSSSRRRGGALAGDGEVVTQLKFSKDLGENQIARKLAQLDGTLTPQGPGRLLDWNKKTWKSAPVAHPITDKSALLLIHGTFSNSESLVGELNSTEDGKAFLRKTAANFDRILSFDHFTVSRSPVVNALDLAREMERHSFERVGIVCHSRGGLVTRWWLEAFNRKPLATDVVLVGCPMRGTSLADPQSLRNGLNLLTNVGKLLGDACTLIPLLTAAGGLMQIVTAITGFAAKTPLIDAAIAMIPGLASMSRTRNNFELEALNHGPAVARPGYSAVLSDFQPDSVDWRFWRLFNLDRIKSAAADHLVFEQANDLVVDTESMTYYAFGAEPLLTDKKSFLYFEKSAKVFHTNYFRDADTLQFIADRLGI